MSKEIYSREELSEERVAEEISDMLGQEELNLQSVKNKEDLSQLVNLFRKKISCILELQKEYPDCKSKILEDLVLVRDKIRVGNFKTGHFEWYFESFDKIKNKEEKWEKLEEMVEKALEEDRVMAEYIKPEVLSLYYKNLLNKVIEFRK